MDALNISIMITVSGQLPAERGQCSFAGDLIFTFAGGDKRLLNRFIGSDLPGKFSGGLEQ